MTLSFRIEHWQRSHENPSAQARTAAATMPNTKIFKSIVGLRIHPTVLPVAQERGIELIPYSNINANGDEQFNSREYNQKTLRHQDAAFFVYTARFEIYAVCDAPLTALDIFGWRCHVNSQ